nr:hypothetical protein [Candidatus Freyarchaeota archaeon]
MILHIYVVDISGVPVYAHCVGHDACQLEQFDELSVSGLLTALNTFAKDLGMGGGDLQAIHMYKSKFLLKTESKFFIAFHVESGDKIEKYRKAINSVSSFIQSIYPSAPFSEKDRLKIVPQIENFLDESGLLTKTRGLLERIKSASKSQKEK